MLHTPQSLFYKYIYNMILFVNTSKKNTKSKKGPSGFLRKGLGANYEKDVLSFRLINLLSHVHIPCKHALHALQHRDELFYILLV